MGNNLDKVENHCTSVYANMYSHFTILYNSASKFTDILVNERIKNKGTFLYLTQYL